MVRLDKIVTKAGDGGMTRLATGEPVSKASARVEAYGSVDEINSTIGVARLYTSGDFVLDPMLGAISASGSHHLPRTSSRKGREAIRGCPRGWDNCNFERRTRKYPNLESRRLPGDAIQARRDFRCVKEGCRKKMFHPSGR